MRQAIGIAPACHGEQQGEAVAGLLLGEKATEHVEYACLWYCFDMLHEQQNPQHTTASISTYNTHKGVKGPLSGHAHPGHAHSDHTITVPTGHSKPAASDEYYAPSRPCQELQEPPSCQLPG